MSSLKVQGSVWEISKAASETRHMVEILRPEEGSAQQFPSTALCRLLIALSYNPGPICTFLPSGFKGSFRWHNVFFRKIKEPGVRGRSGL